MFITLCGSLALSPDTLCRAQSEKLVAPPFVVRAKVESSTVMVGQPLEIRINLEPRTTKDIAVLVGDSFAWCRFEIYKGNNVVAKWKPTFSNALVQHKHPRKVLELQGMAEITATLPSSVTNLPTGDYVLRLTTTIKHSYDVRAKWEPDDDSLKLVQNDVVDIPISIETLDVAAMKERISKLYRAIGRETDPQAIRDMSCELAISPPEYASRAWRSLLFDKKIDSGKRYAIARVFSAHGTKPMAQAFLDVQYTDPIRDSDGKIVTLISLLMRMSDANGGRGLRDYIYSEVVKHKDSPFQTPWTQDGTL